MSTAPLRKDQANVLRPQTRKRNASAEDAPRSPSESIRLVVKAQGGVTLLRLDEIECFEAQGNIVVVHTVDGGKHRLREPLSSVLDRLSGHGFVRVHRGAVVRAAAITGVEKGRYRKAFAVLRGGTRLEIGRAEFHKLRALWQPGVLDLRELGSNLHLVSTTD